MENKKIIIYCIFALLVITFLFLNVYAQEQTNGTGSGGGGIAPQPSNNTGEGGGGSVNESNYTSEYDLEILEEFNKTDWVKVTIVIKDNSNITIVGTKEERRNLSNLRAEWFKSEEDRILATFSENEIRNINKIVGAFSAEITKQGFDKLVNDTRIEKIILAYMKPGYATGNETVIEKSKESILEKEKMIRLTSALKISIIIIIIFIIILYIMIKKRKIT